MKEVLSFLVIVLCWCVGTLLSTWLPLPGTLIGLILLFLMLVAMRRVPSSLQRVARFLLNYLAIFFIPAFMGVLLFKQQLLEHGVAVLLVIVLSTSISLALTGWVAKRYIQSHTNGGAHD